MKKIVCVLSCVVLIATTSLLIFPYESKIVANEKLIANDDTNNRLYARGDEIQLYKYNIELLQINNTNNNENMKQYTIKGKEVVGVNVTKIEINNRWNIELTEDEIDLLAKIVWKESSGESDKGQQAVVEVVFNRMRHWDFEGTLYEVLSRKNAFSTWKLRNTAKPTKREYKNIKKVLNNKTDITTPDTVYFSTSARNNKVDVIIGNHVFCKYELEKE